MGTKGSLKTRLSVVRENIFAGGEEVRGFGIFFGDKFDNQLLGMLGKKCGQKWQGQIVGNGQVVNERQRQGEIKLAAFEKRSALVVAPANAGAGIGQVNDQRQ